MIVVVASQKLYNKSLQVRSAIPHPKILGIIRECGGKMHMRERHWEEAFTGTRHRSVLSLSYACSVDSRVCYNNARFL